MPNYLPIYRNQFFSRFKAYNIKAKIWPNLKILDWEAYYKIKVLNLALFMKKDIYLVLYYSLAKYISTEHLRFMHLFYL